MRVVSKLFVACAAMLVVPGAAMAAVAVTGPETFGEAAGTATYTVTCDATDLLVSIEVAPGPDPAATEGTDYEDASATVNCATAQEHTFEVPVIDDSADEGGENFTVTATPGVVLPDPGSFTTTITDNDPVASIAPLVLVTEGDSGTKNAVLEVKLASAPVTATTVGYATDDHTAKAGPDYTQRSGEVVFQPGQTSKTISIPVVGDTGHEGAEAFFVNLTSTSNGSLSQTARQAVVGIFDNDQAPVPEISITRTVTVDEGNRGTVNTLFTVALSFAPAERVEVGWKTLDWTATAPDYDAEAGKLVFQPGQQTKTISVNVRGDRTDEPDETFGVLLEDPVGATLAANDGGFGIIVDDDGPKMGIGKPRARGRTLVTKLRCPGTATRCRGVLRAKSGRTRIGKESFDLLKGTRQKVRIDMSRKARRKLARKDKMRVKLVAIAADASGAERKTKRRARVKRRR